VQPVAPNATQSVKNELCYLYQIKGQKTLSGVQDCSWSTVSDVTYVNQTTGVYPAIVGGDFLYTNAVSQATTAWNAGSLSMIRYHMGRPEDADSYASSQLTTDLADTLTPGTARYNGLMTKFDHASSELLRLKTAGVVVIWAPFHENQPGGWFWWSKGTADQFKQLWNLMFTNFAAKGVNNVIWLDPYSGSPSAAFYPGKAVVDISGSDTYGDSQPFASNYRNAATAVGSTTMPLALHETGYVPNPTDMFNNAAAPWVLFSVWCTNTWLQSTAKNTVAELKQAFNNPLTINRGGFTRF
jgi:mannan endo-1,4-beta-mannosidase